MKASTFAGLAGIGTVFLTSAILTAITVELWFLRIAVTDGPPPRIDQLLVLTWFAGSFVATRLGGLRAAGVVSLYALGVLSLTVARFAIEAPLQCALVPRGNCSANVLEWIAGTSWVRDGLAGQLWIIPGLLLGALMARAIRIRIAFGPGLAALSVFAIGIIVANQLTFVARYTVCFSPALIAQCIDQEYLFWFAAHIVLGVLASMALARLGGRPRDALVLGGILFVAYLPGPVHQIVMISGDGLPAVLGNLGALAGVLTFVMLSFRRESGISGRGGQTQVTTLDRLSGERAPHEERPR